MLPEALSRAELSRGISDDYIYRSIQRQIERIPLGAGATLVDVGCGRGNIEHGIRSHFSRVIGVDAVRHEGWREEDALVIHDLNTPGVDLPTGCADVVLTCEVLPHVESPRVLVRECVRLCKPGGWLIVHVPNVLSFLSYLTLLVRGRFAQFPDVAADFMITPLLENDVLRMFQENGMIEARSFYTGSARLPYSAARVPGLLSRLSPRLFSDNLGIIAQKPPRSPGGGAKPSAILP